MPDMLVPIDDLRTAGDQLGQIIAELETAGANQDDVEAAVGSPFGDSRLRDRCQDFEGSWNDSRDKLLTKLRAVQQRIVGTVDEVTAADQEMAAGLEPSGATSSSTDAPVAV